jgi:hypothetical protein
MGSPFELRVIGSVAGGAIAIAILMASCFIAVRINLGDSPLSLYVADPTYSETAFATGNCENQFTDDQPPEAANKDEMYLERD